MQNRKMLVAAAVLLLAGGLAACGTGSSSSTTGGSGAPTDASEAAFCKTFAQLGADVTPKEAADRLNQVGTPQSIDSGARHGFEVLVDHLRQLPDDAKDSDLTTMAQDLEEGDQADVISFLQYYGDACTDLSSAPSS